MFQPRCQTMSRCWDGGDTVRLGRGRRFTQEDDTSSLLQVEQERTIVLDTFEGVNNFLDFVEVCPGQIRVYNLFYMFTNDGCQSRLQPCPAPRKNHVQRQKPNDVLRIRWLESIFEDSLLRLFQESFTSETWARQMRARDTVVNTETPTLAEWSSVR